MSNNQLLERDLLLANLSEQAYPAVNTYQAIENLDLSQLNNVDSAGVAYLVQIKTQYPTLKLVNASAKLRVLAELYGVETFFEK
ncbi:STAS domain-containing protein [Psychromonas sp. SP041]|uniref:STAS domain-containing protein n=1 Tax=Psychromonas sp. SP041 TaxID=1365007 RepID=UPI0003F71CF6|nr:STAS domain-containing protein [Psychromonas sp. SP041]